ncbi:MAG: glycosyltransferase family 2 protein [Prevotella sp.]|nr:glycosyltransferase family 2 protein [Prevotella sp.]
MEKVFFVMPAYNEAENIEKTVEHWYPVIETLSQKGIDAKLVIANDGSKDDTYVILNKIVSKYPMMVPINKPNSGHGATVLFLYRHCIENGADYIFQTDSDGQTNPEEFWEMWDNRDNYDFQIGHRRGREDGISRIIVTKVLKFVVWFMFHVWVNDANTPFRLMKTNKLIPILEKIPKDFFLCNVAISAIAVKWNYNIGWYKITFRPRQGGVNSINMKRIIKIGWKALSDFKIINKNLK